MPGGAPYTLLQYPDGGIDGCGVIASASYSYHSPLLASHLIQKDVNMQDEKRGEQFAVDVRGDSGTVTQGQNSLTSAGFEYGISTMISTTPMQVVSTANKGGSNTLVYNQNWTRGFQGDAFNNNNPYLSSTKNLVNSTFMTDMRNQMVGVAKNCDKVMFQSIFGNNYVNKSSATGLAMTQATVTYASHITHAPIVWTPNLVTATDLQMVGAEEMGLLSQAVNSSDANGYSIGGSYQAPFLMLPDYMFDPIMTPLSTVFHPAVRHNSQTSDGTFIPVNTLFATVNNITTVRLPLDWFYTVVVDTKNLIVCPMMTQDSVHWYAPKQNGTMIDMLRSVYNTMPGFTQIPGMNPAQLSQFLFNSLAGGPNPALSYEEIMHISERYADPLAEMLRKGIENKYPTSMGYGGCYDPMCYGINTYALPPSSSDITSWATAVVINRFAGAVRRMPEYIVPIHIDPALIVKTPPTYANPYTATFAAFNSMEPQHFEQFAYHNKELVEEDLKVELIHKSNSRENTTRELIEQVMGKDWQRKSTPPVIQPSTFEDTMRGYDRMKNMQTRAQREAVDKNNTKKMTESLGKIGV